MPHKTREPEINIWIIVRSYEAKANKSSQRVQTEVSFTTRGNFSHVVTSVNFRQCSLDVPFIDYNSGCSFIAKLLKICTPRTTCQIINFSTGSDQWAASSWLFLCYSHPVSGARPISHNKTNTSFDLGERKQGDYEMTESVCISLCLSLSLSVSLSLEVVVIKK